MMGVGVDAQESQRGAVEHFIGTLIRQTATACPLSSPADQAALDRCRAALYGESAFRRGIAPVVLGDRPSPRPRQQGLLKHGAVFESMVDAARDWETKNP